MSITEDAPTVDAGARRSVRLGAARMGSPWSLLVGASLVLVAAGDGSAGDGSRAASSAMSVVLVAHARTRKRGRARMQTLRILRGYHGRRAAQRDRGGIKSQLSGPAAASFQFLQSVELCRVTRRKAEHRAEKVDRADHSDR